MNEKSELKELGEVKITAPSMRITNQRIYCHTFIPELKKAKGSNIILLQGTTAENKKGDISRIPRFIVAGAAPDSKDVIMEKGVIVEEIPIELGDEVFPFWPEGVEGFSFPRVFDPVNQISYTVLHFTELCGYTKNAFVEVKEEN